MRFVVVKVKAAADIRRADLDPDRADVICMAVNGHGGMFEWRCPFRDAPDVYDEIDVQVGL